MRLPLAQIIDVEALGSVVLASLVAGLGLTVLFSILIFSATRAAESRREGGVLVPAVLGVVAVLALAGCLGLVAFGLYLMVSE